MLSKKVTHKKLRPKQPKEPKFLNWLHNVKQPSCFVCNISVGISMHHIKKNSTDYRNDSLMLPLCYEHHQGTNFSVHNNPKEFKEEYPLEMQLKRALELYTEYKGN